MDCFSLILGRERVVRRWGEENGEGGVINKNLHNSINNTFQEEEEDEEDDINVTNSGSHHNVNTEDRRHREKAEGGGGKVEQYDPKKVFWT